MEQIRIEENLESTDYETIENIEEKNHPWNSLSTETTFDEGIDINTRSTLCLNNISKTEASGQIAQRCIPSSSVLIGSLIQQLCTIFESDKVRRNKLYYAICDKLHELKLIDDSYNMMKLDVLRGHYQRALYRLVTVARNITVNENPVQIPSLVSELSRYHREFHELNFIAGGGFGKVFKALHRLDGTEYAIKKVIVSSNCMETIKQYLNEVKTLAKLNHANIVPYKAAWIEPTFLPFFVSNVLSTNHDSHKSRTSNCMQKSKSRNTQSIKDSHSNSDRQNILFDKETSRTIGIYINAKIKQQSEMHGSVRDFVATSSDINKRFEELNSLTNIIGKRINEKNTQEDSEEIDSDIVFFRNSKNSENLDQTVQDNTDSTEEDYNSSYEESNSHQELCTYTSNGNGQYMTLYIQMALCEQTLEKWMRCRINVTPHAIITAVLQQILLGIDYIHSQKIVHHDIKPSNIFISTSGQLQIQLGDFGLACPQRKNHHSIIGTHMYAAPEQLQGKCDPKSDIYSVGIVLTELSIPTQTQMELSFIISCLKCGNIPETFTKERHKWAQIITRLIQEDPAKRPSTNHLLQDLKDDKDMLITELKNTVVVLEKDLCDKNNTIQELEETIVLLKEEIKKHRQISSENTKLLC